jgi:hypothetical protein
LATREDFQVEAVEYGGQYGLAIRFNQLSGRFEGSVKKLSEVRIAQRAAETEEGEK